MKDKGFKNKLKNAFREAQAVAHIAAGYAGAVLGVASGEVPAAVFALDYSQMKAGQARLNKQTL